MKSICPARSRRSRLAVAVEILKCFSRSQRRSLVPLAILSRNQFWRSTGVYADSTLVFLGAWCDWSSTVRLGCSWYPDFPRMMTESSNPSMPLSARRLIDFRRNALTASHTAFCPRPRPRVSAIVLPGKALGWPLVLRSLSRTRILQTVPLWAAVRLYRTVQIEGEREVVREVESYNLDNQLESDFDRAIQQLQPPPEKP
jgi:hypothetical protein